MHDSMRFHFSSKGASRAESGSTVITWLGAAALCGSLLFAPLVSAQAPAAPEASRAADGHPDLSGTWDNGSGIDFVRPQQRGESVCVSGCGPAAGAPPRPQPQAGAPAPRGTPRPSYRPEFAAKVADLTARQVKEDPVLRCESPGVPRIGPPDKIVQRAGEVVFLYDDVSGNFFRIVPTDGRAHRTDTEPTALGDAVGHWEGDTLVVETTQFNDETWLTDDGAFHTTDLRVVERLKRNGDSLEWTATVYDPKVLSEPWELRARSAKLTTDELIEAPPCVDRSLEHMVDDSHHPNPR
jgi:uncharacterized protein (DUF2147 family)